MAGTFTSHGPRSTRLRHTSTRFLPTILRQMIRSTAPALVFLLLLTACGEPAPPVEDTAVPPDRLDTPEAVPEPVDRLSDDEKLFLIEELPIGSTYSDVREVFPTVGPDEPTGVGMTEKLSRAEVPVRVLEDRAVLEFNFDDGTLYSYYFRHDSLSCSEAERMRDRLTEIFSNRFGESSHESEAEPGYAMESTYWNLGDRDVGLAMTLGRQADACRLAWGYQIDHPEHR